MSATRPDPDALLAEVTREEEKARRGRLKIFFGASAGVGKTYAMLTAASQLRGQGIDVVVGLLETHGRRETALLLEGLELLPPKLIQHRGATLREFDLDGAILRRPTVLLVDELAHSNAPGSRHTKRWQDVEELLNAGIDVFSTINVQHIESLNDIVGGITGIRVWETIPDRIFDSADEVVLVDLPPDDLLQRLKEGKVYLPDQAERAVQNFFRKGNLIALRELALRRTADRVDDQMRSYRHERISGRVLQTREAILACVGPSAGGHKTVRSASRLAAALDARWHAVYAETLALQRLPDAKRRAILESLKFAQDLGAVTATVPAQDAAAAIVDYARKIGLTTVVVGRPLRKGYWRSWGKDFAQRLSALAPDLEVVIVAEETLRPRAESSSGGPTESRDGQRSEGLRRYAGSLLASVATTLLALPLQPYFDLANIDMLFLLAVVLVSVQWGRGPAVMAAIVNVAAFDFFFVPPRFSFAVSDVQYLVTFGVLLAVGLITGQLTAGLRYQARIALHREERARALYEMARELSSALTEEQVCEIADRFVEASFHAKVAILLPDANEHLHPAEVSGLTPGVDQGIAQWAFDRGESAGIGTDTLSASPVLYLPLKAPVRNRGVMAIEPDNARLLMIPEQRRQLETFAVLIAIALERVHFVTVARDTLLTMESERLRNSLLSALSHDLRTPLTALVGLAETLALQGHGLTQVQVDIANAMREQAVRMVQLVNNLLDMARLESGQVQLRKDWQSIAELTSTALQSRREALSRHRVKLDLPLDLPLVMCDAVLIERVLVNLLENAAKYTPDGTLVGVTAAAKPETLEVTVFDEGPGLPRGQERAVFEKFVRGQKESGMPGVGLGLAICKVIVEAHGGEISAANRPDGGALFTFWLPLSPAPAVAPVDSTQP